MERKIGEEFDVKIRVRAVEDTNGLTCTICALSGICESYMDVKSSPCYPMDRTDGKNIYYELVSYEEV